MNNLATNKVSPSPRLANPLPPTLSYKPAPRDMHNYRFVERAEFFTGGCVLIVEISSTGTDGGDASETRITLTRKVGEVNFDLMSDAFELVAHGDQEAHAICRAFRFISDVLAKQGFGPAEVWSE